MSRRNFLSSNPWARLAVPGAGIFLLVFLAYLPALHGGFVWDDGSWTTDLSGLFQNASGLRTMWCDPTALQQYYPLSGTTFWLDYQLWKFWTTPYHVENVLLHALAALLLWRLLLRLRVPGAWLAGALFALHPVMVESVAWITERKNVLSLVFYLGAWLAYLRYQQGGERSVAETKAAAPIPDSSPVTRHPSLYYSLALVLFLGALLAKTTTFSLPAAMLLVGWWQRGQIRWRADVLPTLPFFALALGLCAVTAWLEQNHVGAKGSDFALTFSQRCLIAGQVFWFYPGKLFWPANLCLVYPRWQPDPGEWEQWVYPVTAMGALFTLWLARGRLGRGPVTALLFFVGSLFPVLGFMNAYFMRYSFACDHWVYLPSLGLMALVAALVVRAAIALRTPGVVYGFGAIVLPLLALLTWRQAGMYTDVETLWQTTLAKNPDCWIAHGNLGTLCYDAGHKTEAEEHFRQAVQLNPNYYEAINNLGVIFIAQGRLDEAMDNFQRAIRLRPDYPPVLYNLGRTLAIQGKFDEAIKNYRSAIRLKPDYFLAHDKLGQALAAEGRFAEAIESFQKAIQFDSRQAETHLDLGEALGQLGRSQEAAVQYREALKLNPDLVEALNNLAWILASSAEDKLRNGAEAVRLAEHACALTHYGEPLFIGTLAAAYAEAGRFPEAVTTAEKAEQVATAAGLTNVAAKNRQLLELYRAGKPYQEPPPPKP